jgi:hypothetical protein
MPKNCISEEKLYIYKFSMIFCNLGWFANFVVIFAKNHLFYQKLSETELLFSGRSPRFPGLSPRFPGRLPASQTPLPASRGSLPASRGLSPLPGRLSPLPGSRPGAVFQILEFFAVLVKKKQKKKHKS